MGYDSVLMQGSGTFSVEGVVSTVVPPPSKGGKMLVVSNGAYGLRMGKMCEIHGIDHKVLKYDDNQKPTASEVVAALKGGAFTHVGIIHHETTAGLLNPVEAIGVAINAFDPKITFIVDSMSGFGAYPLDLEKSHIHYMVSSANKNIEGVPGFAFAVFKKDKLVTEGVHARTLSLDMKANWEGLEANGQFRFTPPTHALLAFHQAMKEMKEEGGVDGRMARYKANCTELIKGMGELGFKPYLDDDKQGHIITTFLWPDDPHWDFQAFYNALGELGIVIYPGKLTKANCFRLGNIGRMFPSDMRYAVLCVQDVLTKMGVALPVKQIM